MRVLLNNERKPGYCILKIRSYWFLWLVELFCVRTRIIRVWYLDLDFFLIYFQRHILSRHICQKLAFHPQYFRRNWKKMGGAAKCSKISFPLLTSRYSEFRPLFTQNPYNALNHYCHIHTTFYKSKMPRNPHKLNGIHIDANRDPDCHVTFDPLPSSPFSAFFNVARMWHK